MLTGISTRLWSGPPATRPGTAAVEKVRHPARAIIAYCREAQNLLQQPGRRLRVDRGPFWRLPLVTSLMFRSFPALGRRR